METIDLDEVDRWVQTRGLEVPLALGACASVLFGELALAVLCLMTYTMVRAGA
jgi:hypothetical protein